jgi:phosphoribosylamine--glycine ligase
LKVLIIGGGGREHALAWKISQSKRVKQIFCAPGNGGTHDIAENVPIADTDIDALVKFAQEKSIDLTIVGPEDPLALGVVDRFEAKGLRVFGPSAAAAQIEANKSFAKKVMREQSIPTAEARTFTAYKDARNYLATRDSAVVLKASGLAKGKGVFVCDDPAEALVELENMMVKRVFGKAGDTVVVEEKLTGQEASILALVDGQNIYVLEAAQDHKPIGDGDTGPNTGGMGAFCPTPIITDAVHQQIQGEIIVPLLEGMLRNEAAYRGILYCGVMLTAAGPKVLEFNCRFGDPEAQPILMRLKTDLIDAIEATIDGRLDQVTLEWDPRPSLCVVMASGGYPGEYQKGIPIHGLREAGRLDDVVVFHAGTSLDGDTVVTSGGRVLGVTAVGQDVQAAQQRAYEAVELISFEGACCRRDIGDKAIKAPAGR